MNNHDTICAIATSPGSGAIAVIRLSGEDALKIANLVFKPANKKKKLLEQKANTIHFGTISDNNQLIDEVLLSIFKAPHSYTGENSVEISCHGSSHIQAKILELLIKKGARLAQPGEYTLRAFQNGKMDLSQAEAVADLIASSSESSRKVAMNQMRGGFRDEIQDLRMQLLNFISLIELELDFSEEDVEFADRKQLKILTDKIGGHLKTLIDSFKLGNVIKNGIPVAIIGEPNVGKSTLLNALLNEDKAIISDIPGTTRDAIEDTISIEGVLFRFIDTAGLRETSDTIEGLGIERSKQKMNAAEIILQILDAKNSDFQALFRKLKAEYPQKNIIPIVNKSDLFGRINMIREIDGTDIIYISAKHKHNLKELENTLLKVINYSSTPDSATIITNTRHYEALTKAHEAILRVSDGIDTLIPTDFLAMDIRETLHYLGEISGEITNDEILGNIFKNFCIGK